MEMMENLSGLPHSHTPPLTPITPSDFLPVREKIFYYFSTKSFFDNDLWILDPATDLLINIVPEPFFADTAARIAFTFSFLVLALFFICLACIRRSGNETERPGRLP